MKRILITCDNTDITNIAALQNQPFDNTFPISRLAPNQNLNLEITNLTNCILKQLDPILTDLLELATFVYAADSDVVRGTDTTIFEGEEWQRDFTFIIPCQNPDLWNSATINNHIKQMVEFLTGDKFTFYFVQGKPDPNQLLIAFVGIDLPPFPNANCVSLFSGGLDSLSGVVDDVKQGYKPVLVSHRSYPPMNHLQKVLVDLLKARLPQWSFPHLSLWANRHGIRKTEYTQRSRSLLYFSIATVVAAQCCLDTVHFYENGIITFNLPLLAQNVGTRLTRTTHPKFVKDFSQLIKLILPDKTIKYENPFLWKTKEEIIEGLKNNGLPDLTGGTVSCTRSWMMNKLQRHCGVCSQCVDRRFAVESQGVQQHDPIHGYITDIFIQGLKDGADKSCAIGYVQTALKISEITKVEQFFEAYPELYSVFNYLDGTASDRANKIYDLFQRHASNVINVMDRMVGEHSDDLVKGKLPESCLISMVSAQKHISKLPQPQTSTPDKSYAYVLSDKGREDITQLQYSDSVKHKGGYDIFIDGFTKEVWHKDKKGESLTDSEFTMIKTYIETGKLLASFQVTGYVKEYKKTEENIAWNDKKFHEMVDKGDTIDEEKWETLKNSSEFAEEMLHRIAESAYVIFKSARRKVDIKQGKEFLYFSQKQRKGRDRLAKYQFKPEGITYCLIIPS